MPTALSLTLSYIKFWNTILESEYLSSSLRRKLIENSFGRFTTTSRARHTFPWISESLIKKTAIIFLNCYPLRKLAPLILNLSFFFDRIVEYTFALKNAPVENEVVLDIGAGYGFFPTYLASRSNAISLDIDRDVMFFQKKASKAMGGPVSKKLECVIADSKRLPFKDKSISRVFIISTIEHIPEDNLVAKESGRVLTQTGTCIMSFPFSKLETHPQVEPYFQRDYTNEMIKERLINPSSLSIHDSSSVNKALVSLFYGVFPQGWLIFKDLTIGLFLLKLDELLFPVSEGALSIISLRKDFEEGKRKDYGLSAKGCGYV